MNRSALLWCSRPTMASVTFPSLSRFETSRSSSCSLPSALYWLRSPASSSSPGRTTCSPWNRKPFRMSANTSLCSANAFSAISFSPILPPRLSTSLPLSSSAFKKENNSLEQAWGIALHVLTKRTSNMLLCNKLDYCQRFQSVIGNPRPQAIVRVPEREPERSCHAQPLW